MRREPDVHAANLRALFRLFEDAMTNIEQHADATEVRLSLRTGNGRRRSLMASLEREVEAAPATGLLPRQVRVTAQSKR